MKKHLMKIILFSLALVFVIPSVSFASNYGFKQGDYVDLNGYRFIVLEPTSGFLFADFYLENRAFDLGNISEYNPNDSNNVGYYLNHTFLDNLGGFSEYIRYYDWTPTAQAKVGLISTGDWTNFSIFGNINNGFLKNPIYSFWTRSLSWGPYIYTIDYKGHAQAIAAQKTAAVRPALYLEAGLSKTGIGTLDSPYKMSVIPLIVLSNVSDLSLLKTTPTEITISWGNPIESNFSHLNIYKNGTIVETNFTKETYTFKSLNPSQQYEFTIKAVDMDGVETTGNTIIVSTDDMPLVPEVQNLNATTKHDRINLSWQNPESEYFHHVKIYRRTEQDHSPTAAIQQNKIEEIFVGKIVSAEETTDPAFDPMFETNGTYWNDLTVEPSTTYGYKLTTENIAGAESEGLIVQATTLAEPLPEMGGEEVNTDENGDYKVSWTSPTEGQVKILVDGNEYAVVDASLGEYVIPAADMKYDLFGKPKVQLVAVSSSGKEGEATKPPVNGESSGSIGVNMPFTVTEFLKTVLSLIGWISPFILLALAIRFAPRIIAFLKGVIAKFREGKLRL